jgi:hypothetical protein
MAKVAFYLSLFCAGSATASLIGWLVALSPVFTALSFWLVFVLIAVMASLIVFDDGMRSLLAVENENLYYGIVILSFLSILLGVSLIWICN